MRDGLDVRSCETGIARRDQKSEVGGQGKTDLRFLISVTDGFNALIDLTK